MQARIQEVGGEAPPPFISTKKSEKLKGKSEKEGRKQGN